MIDRETATQIVVAGGAVVLFIAVAAYVSSSFGAENHLTEAGGFALVGGVAVFVVLTTIAGLWLARKEFEDAAEAAEDGTDGANGTS